MADNQRYLALDVFRGMTVCFMIIVNSPGGNIAYPPLLHASWHGFTPTDLVFPSFLFAVGNAMAFVMSKYEALGANVFWRKTIKRTLIIFLLGYLMYWFPFFQTGEGGTLELKPLAETRIFGVLQRIALCYFFASVILFYGSKNFAVWFSVFALLSYWILMYALGDPSDPYAMVGNYGSKLDLILFNEKHLYHGEGIAFEPEGLLSTLPSIVNVIMGYLVGDYIRRNKSSFESIAKLMLVGAALIFAALTWDIFFPINKKLWTSSFVLLTVGLGTVILAALMYVIDIKKKDKWTYFFVVFGRNPLFIYLLSELALISLLIIPSSENNARDWLNDKFFGSFASPIHASFLFAAFFMLACWTVGYILDRKKIYVRV